MVDVTALGRGILRALGEHVGGEDRADEGLEDGLGDDGSGGLDDGSGGLDSGSGRLDNGSWGARLRSSDVLALNLVLGRGLVGVGRLLLAVIIARRLLGLAEVQRDILAVAAREGVDVVVPHKVSTGASLSIRLAGTSRAGGVRGVHVPAVAGERARVAAAVNVRHVVPDVAGRVGVLKLHDVGLRRDSGLGGVDNLERDTAGCDLLVLLRVRGSSLDVNGLANGLRDRGDRPSGDIKVTLVVNVGLASAGEGERREGSRGDGDVLHFEELGSLN